MDALSPKCTLTVGRWLMHRILPWLQAHTHPPGGLGNYYRENVTGGEGSFVLEIHSYEQFAEAVTRKLLEEIASIVRPGGPRRG